MKANITIFLISAPSSFYSWARKEKVSFYIPPPPFNNFPIMSAAKVSVWLLGVWEGEGVIGRNGKASGSKEGGRGDAEKLKTPYIFDIFRKEEREAKVYKGGIERGKEKLLL